MQATMAYPAKGLAMSQQNLAPPLYNPVSELSPPYMQMEAKSDQFYPQHLDQQVYPPPGQDPPPNQGQDP